jgi:hypothetical protein
MGRWFPAIRRGTREQSAAYRAALVALFRNGREERAAGTRSETARFAELNAAAARAEEPLNAVQRVAGRHRATDAEERGYARARRQERRASRAAR